MWKYESRHQAYSTCELLFSALHLESDKVRESNFRQSVTRDFLRRSTDFCADARANIRQNSPTSRKVKSLMEQLLNCLWKIWNDDQGQDIAEYALMLTVILLVVVGAVTSIGSHANTIFNTVAGQLSAS